MWLVGYLFNNNGMGTWCWEAAHALAAAGEDVAIVCSSSVQLPGETDLELIRVDAPVLGSTFVRVFADGGLLSSRGPRVMREAVRRVEASGRRVDAVLLNATEFHDEHVSAPQLVVAWARGVTLSKYLRRFLDASHASRASPRRKLASLLGTIGWWRRDWRAFAGANGVLAVTTPLQGELSAHGVDATLLYPCTHGSLTAPVRTPGSPIRLVTSAVSLGDPRKRVEWMLHALEGWHSPGVTLTLIGEPDAAVQYAASRLGIDVTFTGALVRSAALEVVATHDIFLFASALDDWGYVLTEAMGLGLAVVAPDIAPFDEILGDTGARFAPGDAHAFRSAVENVVKDIAHMREACWSRSREQFSRSAFVAALRQVLEQVR